MGFTIVTVPRQWHLGAGVIKKGGFCVGMFCPILGLLPRHGPFSGLPPIWSPLLQLHLAAPFQERPGTVLLCDWWLPCFPSVEPLQFVGTALGQAVAGISPEAPLDAVPVLPQTAGVSGQELCFTCCLGCFSPDSPLEAHGCGTRSRRSGTGDRC